jgi:hypothetical protein
VLCDLPYCDARSGYHPEHLAIVVVTTRESAHRYCVEDIEQLGSLPAVLPEISRVGWSCCWQAACTRPAWAVM